jgi:hypothetical protein
VNSGAEGLALADWSIVKLDAIKIRIKKKPTFFCILNFKTVQDKKLSKYRSILRDFNMLMAAENVNTDYPS